MITDKQRQRDLEYEADYSHTSRFSQEQWGNILESGQLGEECAVLFETIYSSFNHAANLLQLSFHLEKKEEDILDILNQAGRTLGEVNQMEAEVDFQNKEYWWYLFFSGKNLPEGTLELKLHPELTEALAARSPQLEEAYYAFASEVERSLQIRYSQEEAVWIAAAVLLYEKYYRYPGISTDDILLMQYEIQTRAQKVFGQDVDTSTISTICNADERGHRYNYLRDMYKYYRVSFPGEFDDDRERPEPDDMDYGAWIYSLYGYMTLENLYDFISHEYAHLVDETYIELTGANGFVRLAAFLSRQGGKHLSQDDKSEKASTLRTDGADGIETFHMIGESLIKEYPNFTWLNKSSWYDEGQEIILPFFEDRLYVERHGVIGAYVGIRTLTEGDDVHIETSLHLPFTEDEDAMADIRERCDRLPLMTTAAFQVKVTEADASDPIPTGKKIKAYVLYPYNDLKTMTEENIIALFGSSLHIFASYYTDLCQNYYPSGDATETDSKGKGKQSGDSDGSEDGAGGTTGGSKKRKKSRSSKTGSGKKAGKEDSNTEDGGSDKEEAVTEDALKAALGSKLTYRPASDTPGPNIVYKEIPSNPDTDYITKTLQKYAGYDEEEGEETSSPRSASASSPTGGGTRPSGGAGSSSAGSSAGSFTGSGGGQSQPGSYQAAPYQAGLYQAGPLREKTYAASHPDRTDQSDRPYPKNILLKGPMKTRKFHEAIMTSVGIIEGKDLGTLGLEPVPDILERFKEYEQDGHILHIACPDLGPDGYESFIENDRGQDGIFKEFANRCAKGRYVVLIEEADLNWRHLFGEASILLRENRREGASSETLVTLRYSGEKFRMPSNLYLVVTCDSLVCEDMILSAVDYDFLIRPILPDPSVLRSMRIEGISLEKLMTTINNRISYFLGPEYQLGEGFYLSSSERTAFASLARAFREQILPILERWFDGDIERIRYVLGDNGKNRSDTMFYLEVPFRDHLFKGSLPDSFDRNRKIYRLNEEAFSIPASYVSVYE